jgi:hypothetical protein
VYYVILLLSDGTVVEEKEFGGDPYPDVKNWKEIKSIQAGFDCIFGIDAYGKVYQARETGGDSNHYNVSSLSNVVRLVEVNDNLIVLGQDGSLSALGGSSYYTKAISGKSNVQDIVKFQNEEGSGLLVLYKDGTVELIVASSSSETYGKTVDGYYQTIKKELESWNGIVSIQTGASGIIGIRYDGTVNYVSTDISYSTYSSSYTYTSYDSAAQELASWSDIVCISAPYDSNFVIGVKSDGTVVSYVTYSKGGYYKVSDWKLW